MITFTNKIQKFDADDLASVRSVASATDQMAFLTFWAEQDGCRRHWNDFDLLEGPAFLASVVFVVPEHDDIIARFTGGSLVGSRKDAGIHAFAPMASMYRMKDTLPKAILFLEQAVNDDRISYLHEEPASFSGLANFKFSYLGVPLRSDVSGKSAVLAYITYKSDEQ